MAIDTANKRHSIGSLLGLEILPIPDGTISVLDRLQYMGLYSGIAADDPIVVIPHDDIVAFDLVVNRTEPISRSIVKQRAVVGSIVQLIAVDVER